jgi:hypothetical protein
MLVLLEIACVIFAPVASIRILLAQPIVQNVKTGCQVALQAKGPGATQIAFAHKTCMNQAKRKDASNVRSCRRREQLAPSRKMIATSVLPFTF